MYILGISAYYHDSAAALIKDGRVVAAVEEERLSRIKHDNGFPTKAIEYCLAQEGVSINDVDYVVFYEKPFLKFERILMTSFGTFPSSYRFFREAMLNMLKEKLWVKELIQRKLKYQKEVLFVEHHLSHAASAFFCSPFQEAAILTADGVGEWTTTTLGIGKDVEIKLLKEMRFPHSLGLLYSTFTAFLGFEVNEGEYKVMGMAPYGEPRYLDKVYKLLRVADDGSFWLDMQYFSYHYSPDQTFNGNFVKLFGEPRGKSASGGDVVDKHYADIAASIQKALEETLLKMVRYLYKETGLKKLCLAGGVALNSVANGRLLRESEFDDIFIQPAAGDSGGAIGAALYVYHSLLGKKRQFIMEHAYLGPEFRQAEIETFLKDNHIPFQSFGEEELLETVAEALSRGKVLGWFQGRTEWGPRALGDRSILADPRREEMKNIVNSKIKFRELFRPFAPSVLVEKAEDFFELPKAERHFPARFMLYVTPVKEEKRKQVSAITHVDGSARPQIVFKEQNPLYYGLIERFASLTGVPLLLNTSFNLKGEPIVCTPQDAFNTFTRSGLDLLVLGNCLIKK
ncbi:MAG: carbamoyltransferase [Candidatus Brocadiaceae bacterium]|nr:carbamoyltransferase [Candidatus Brocadiaceae bacterium]